MNKKLLSLILFAGTLVGLFVFAPKTDAISNTYLNTAPFPGGNGTGTPSASMVVEYTDAVSIPDINFKWFIPDSYGGNPDIILTGFCAAGNSQAYMNVETFQPDGSWLFEGAYLSNFTAPGYVNLCVGNDLVVTGVANVNFRDQRDPPYPSGPDRYPGYDVLLVTVHLRNRSTFGGLTKFNVTSTPGTFITLAELPENLAQSGAQPGGGGTAIVGNLANTYGYNASFSFRASCAYFDMYNVDGNPNTEPAYLHWRDADGWASYGWRTSWQLIRMSDGAVVAQRGPEAFQGNPGAALGGSSNIHLSAQVTLQKNENYEWRWNNLNHVNTVHVWMSFSEMNVNTPSCATPDSATCTVIGYPATVLAGASYTVTIRAFNTGGATWIPGQWNLGSAPGQTNNHVTNGGGEVRATWGAGGNVPPGGFRDFTYTTNAPASGPFFTGWKMVHEGVAWIPTACQQSINITPMMNVTGVVYNAYSMQGIAGVRVGDVCTTGVTAVTNASAGYSFQVPQGTTYCVYIEGSQVLPGGALQANKRVRPWGQAYRTCSAFNTAAVVNPNYCASQTQYDCQVAGQNQPAACGGGYDKAVDTGFDFVLRYPPVPVCNIVPPSDLEAGSAFSPQVTVSNNGGANRPQSFTSTGVNVVRLNGVQRNISPLPYSIPGTTQPMTVAPPFAGLAAGTYTANGTVNVIGDGLTGSANCPDINIVFGNHSYLKIFGGEVMAGGTFKDTAGNCAAQPADRGGIYAWARVTGGQYVGASAQLTVSALLNINEFFSASERGTAATNTRSPKGLTIANNVAASPTYGGLYNDRRCVDDFYTSTQDPSINRGNWNGQNFGGPLGRRQYGSFSGNLGAGGVVNVPVGVQAAVYTTNSVRIRNNIIYNTGATTTDALPMFILITTGNVYIDRNVTRIDGLIIAQNGVIYTCADSPQSDPRFSNAAVFDNCQNPLTINGGLVGQSIHWLRLRGTLNNATYREKPDFATGCTAWTTGCAGNTRAAEVVNYTPEMWLAPSPLRKPDSDPSTPTATPGNLGNYQAIKSLPPIY